MANVNLPTPPQINLSPRAQAAVQRVTFLDAAAVIKIPAQPTNQDVINAIQVLSKQIQTLSKNQQTIETLINHTAGNISSWNSSVGQALNYLTSIAYGIGVNLTSLISMFQQQFKTYT